MFVLFLSLVFTVVFVCSFFAMQKADLFGAGKVPLSLCIAGLSVVGMSNVSGTLIVGIMPTILLPYQVLAIALIGLLLLVLLDRLCLGASRLRDWQTHRKLRNPKRHIKIKSRPQGSKSKLENKRDELDMRR